MLGVALGYTVQSRFVDHADFAMSSGFWTTLRNPDLLT